MCLKLIPLTGLMLAAGAMAQDAAGPTPAELADQAMKAMDRIIPPTGSGTQLAEAPEQEDKTTKPKKPTLSPKPEAEDGEAAAPPVMPPAAGDKARGIDPMSRARIDLMVPPGRSHRGVHYPMYRPVAPDRSATDPSPGWVPGVTAPLESLFESDIVTRLDNDHVQFDRARWVQYQEQPAPDGTAKPSMTLEIERGVYDLKNEILMTNQPVKIENDQFLITGDTMLHDRASGLTRLTGRVKMTFYNEAPEAPPVAAPAPTPPTPAAPVPPRQP
jgi:hypothetical protein